MSDETPNLPLVVSSSAGSGGVSPRVSVIDRAAGPGQGFASVFGQNFPMPAVIPEDVSKALQGQITTTAAVLQQVMGETRASTQSYAALLVEATRINAEKASNLFQDLASAKSPAEALAVQTAYWQDQRDAFARQTSEFQNAFMKLLTKFAPKGN